MRLAACDVSRMDMAAVDRGPIDDTPARPAVVFLHMDGALEEVLLPLNQPRALPRLRALLAERHGLRNPLLHHRAAGRLDDETLSLEHLGVAEGDLIQVSRHGSQRSPKKSPGKAHRGGGGVDALQDVALEATAPPPPLAGPLARRGVPGYRSKPQWTALDGPLRNEARRWSAPGVHRKRPLGQSPAKAAISDVPQAAAAPVQTASQAAEVKVAVREKSRLEKLPDKVLVRILLKLPSGPDRIVDLLQLSHVCKHLRALILRTPAFFRKIDLSGPIGSTVSPGGLQAVVRWLPAMPSLSLRNCTRLTDLALLRAFRVVQERFCTRLKSVDLSGCDGTHGFVQNLAVFCPCIERLKLPARCRDTSGDAVFLPADQIASVVLGLNDLQSFECASPLVDDSVLKALNRSCRQLKELVIGDPEYRAPARGITSTGINTLAKVCVRLRKLHLFNCTKLDDGAFTALATFSRQLEELHMVNCGQFRPDFLLTPTLHHLPSLRVLSLERIRLRREHLVQIAMATPDLSHLTLVGCTRVNLKFPAAFKVWRKLTNIKLTGMELMDKDVIAIASFCHTVSHLYLGAPAIGDAAVKALALDANELRELVVTDSIALTGSCMDDMGQGVSAKTVESIKFVRCKALTVLRNSSARMLALHTLGLIECETATQDVVRSLLTTTPALLRLQLHGSPAAGALSVDDARKYCPDLGEIEVE